MLACPAVAPTSRSTSAERKERVEVSGVDCDARCPEVGEELGAETSGDGEAEIRTTTP